MAGADLGDERREERLSKLVGKLAEGPDKSLPAALDEAELQAAYRFFSNPAVTPNAILGPHIAATLQRAAEQEVTLAIHDTSTMAFRPDGARSGLGRVRKSGQAFFSHFTLAVAGDGTRRPLGVLAMSSLVRRKGKKKKGNERDRWLEQVKQVASLPASSTRIVHVMDREADDYRLFSSMAGASMGGFVIRLMHDRVLQTDSGETEKLDEALGRIVAVAEREVPLSKRADGDRSPVQKRAHPSREHRLAKLAIGATTITLRRPRDLPQGSVADTVKLNVVRVWEAEPPPGEPAIEWNLITTEPVSTAEDLLRIVDWYRARWIIEEFFKALKTGCAYEKRQIETYEGLLNVLATYCPIAWHLLLMRSECRRQPDAPAKTVLTPIQMQVLLHFSRRPLPAQPSLRQALLAIAALGGHQKHNGEPGWQTLARGYEKLLDLAEGWLAARASKSDES